MENYIKFNKNYYYYYNCNHKIVIKCSFYFIKKYSLSLR